jgi:glutamyl aminopeptidase
VELDVDLYVGVSVQEEVGCRGALTITNKIKPDFAIVLDCSPSDPKNKNGILGKGVLLRVKDANMLAFKSLINYQKEICEKVGVPYQYFISMGGTDAGMIHKSYSGILTLTHCVCAKNLHTSSTIMDINDYLNAKKALIYMLKDLNNDRIKELSESNR